MSLYAESSAILAWLLDEEPGAKVRELLSAEPHVVASDLTLIECDRVLHRAVSLGELAEADAADRRARLANASAHWTLLRISAEVVDRARQPFPGPPVRTPDALHLASLLVARSAVAGLTMLSLDTRVRSAAGLMGIQVRPA